MGSDKHYPEEAPVHRVAVDGFRIDRTPVINRQFKDFARATGHITFAELPPDPKNYPGALPHVLYAGSLVFTPPGRPAHLKFREKSSKAARSCARRTIAAATVQPRAMRKRWIRQPTTSD